MVDADSQFNNFGLSLRAKLNELMRYANKSGHAGKLDLGGYLRGRDPNFLGINRGNYFAKPFGNDSSNVQAVMGGLGYWKRIYYRPDDVLSEVMGVEDAKAKSGAANSGYRIIRESMREKPKLPAGRLSFDNSLADQKYAVRTGKGVVPFKYDVPGHRSLKHEAAFIMSAYFRKDVDLVMKADHEKDRYGQVFHETSESIVPWSQFVVEFLARFFPPWFIPDHPRPR